MPDPAGQRLRLRVRGLVQGVGFRPFVHGLAREFGLGGWVLNDGEGVLVEIEGVEIEGTDCAAFLKALTARAPPLAHIEAVAAEPVAPLGAGRDFVIRDSDGTGAVTTTIPADAGVCPACLAELFDPADRRYRYPFLNCTHCGPRYTITRRLPYDRRQTSMAGFPLCPDCAAEYHDPADRRFHAQPVACPACGPRLSMPVEAILARLQAGNIVAIKGLGGFHLACDAFNHAAVERLRRVKQRNGKPFAVMVASLSAARRLAEIGPLQERLLTGPARPVLLLRRRPDARGLSPAIAPGLGWLGLMLPYTPLHYLLFHEAAGRPDGVDWLDEEDGMAQNTALVMTSANPGGEPLAIANDEARRRLEAIADAVVDHDRDILVRADDSVMRVVAGAPAFVRRARGFVPVPVPLPHPVPSVLAVGGFLKNTVCVTRGAHAYLSQHIGDLDNAATIGFFEQTVAHLLHVLQVTPERVAHDRHPDIFPTRFARDYGLPCVAVQHHHAHIAAVAAEHGWTGPVLGLALDGFGLGDDGGAWGGEMLLVDGPHCERLGHFAPLAQPGGDIAARQPWRMAAAALHRLGRGTEIASRFAAHGPAAGVARMLAQGINTPATSSCGRLFDAACGLLGVRPVAGFEGEAAMLLESLVTTPCSLDGGWSVRDGILDFSGLLEKLSEINEVEGANLFHGTLIAGLIDWTMPALRRHGLGQVALAGGCLMNAVLADGLATGFARHGIAVLLARQVPANDGGLSLGQAWVAALTRL